MRVCLICNQIAAWGKIGGFGTNTRRLGRGLVAEGIDVHVVVPRRQGQARVEKLDGMIVHGQSNWEVFFGKKLYQDIDANIYHVEEPNICGYWAQKAMPDRVHLVTSMDPRGPKEWWAHFFYATWKRRLVFPIQYYYENGPAVRWAVKRAHGVYVEAEFLKPKAKEVYRLPNEPGLLPKPIEIPSGPFKKAKKPTSIFLGRFDPVKQPEMFFQLAQRMPDIDFIAVGRAHDKAYHKYLEKKYFHLPNLNVTGFIDPFKDETLSQLLSRAWVLVLPSAKDAFPTAIQEASVHEVAILSFVDSDRYMSRFGRVARKDGGLDALEHELREMINSGEWREKSKAGRAYNLERHSIAVSIAEHLKQYHVHLEKT